MMGVEGKKVPWCPIIRCGVIGIDRTLVVSSTVFLLGQANFPQSISKRLHLSVKLSDYWIQLREPHKVNEIMKCRSDHRWEIVLCNSLISN